MASHHQSRLHSSNAHPDRYPARPHAVRHDARGGGDFWDGVVAYNAGDYQRALRLWKPVAEQGNKFAQSILGVERTE